jgi:ABC-2 type transport system permease protein
MTTLATRAPSAAPTTRGGVTWPRAVRSEWIKFWSVRSTVWTLLSAVIVIPTVGMMISAVITGDVTPQAGAGAGGGHRLGGLSPLDASLAAVDFGVLIVGVLGVLVGSREYSTGQIRTTLQAVPHRLTVLGAKALVTGSVVFGTMLVAVLAAFFGGQAILSSGGHASASITDSGSVQALLGAAFYLAGVSLIGVALGFLLRSTAGAIGTLIAALMIVPGILGLLLPSSWSGVLDYLPGAAGDAMRGVSNYTGSLGAWAGLLVFVAWVVVLLAGAGAVLKRRDA